MPVISYSDTHELTPGELEKLFLSVEWASGKYPEKLSAAMRNFETVYTAWDGDTLIGLVCAMDDGVMTAYAHFLLVMPAYQGLGIGRHLMDLLMDHYKGYLRLVLAGVNEKVPFYEHLGFVASDHSQVMFLTTLEN